MGQIWLEMDGVQDDPVDAHGRLYLPSLLYYLITALDNRENDRSDKFGKERKIMDSSISSAERWLSGLSAKRTHIKIIFLPRRPYWHPSLSLRCMVRTVMQNSSSEVLYLG
jgi:hypothetical protein